MTDSSLVLKQASFPNSYQLFLQYPDEMLTVFDNVSSGNDPSHNFRSATHPLIANSVADAIVKVMSDEKLIKNEEGKLSSFGKTNLVFQPQNDEDSRAVLRARAKFNASVELSANENMRGIAWWRSDVPASVYEEAHACFKKGADLIKNCDNQNNEKTVSVRLSITSIVGGI